MDPLKRTECLNEWHKIVGWTDGMMDGLLGGAYELQHSRNQVKMHRTAVPSALHDVSAPEFNAFFQKVWNLFQIFYGT